MKVLLIAAMLAALGGTASGQTIVDGSGADIPAVTRDTAITALADKFSDPVSVQVRRIKYAPGEGAICGEVNAKNRFGGYVGFEPFIVNIKKAPYVATILHPDIATAELRKVFVDFVNDVCK